jgi:hypothetical protein
MSWSTSRGRGGDERRAEIARLGEAPRVSRVPRVDADADRGAARQREGGREGTAGALEGREPRVAVGIELLAALVANRAGELLADVLVREHAEIRDRPRPQFFLSSHF